jgi:hypothetical protein
LRRTLAGRHHRSFILSDDKSLPHLADDYILETNGSVRLVVGFDVDDKTKKGTISKLRPGYVENEHGQVELKATQTLYNQVRRSTLEYCTKLY